MVNEMWRCVFVLLASSVIGGCADDRPPVESEREAIVPQQRAVGEDMYPEGSRCTTTVALECRVILPTHGHQRSCFVGVQRCLDGAWGPCVAEEDGGARGLDPR